MNRLAIVFGVAACVMVAFPQAEIGAGLRPGAQGQGPSSMPLPLKVVRTHVVNSRGERVRLRGVNAACLEWSSNGEGHILETVDVAIRDWHVNHIRLPLAQDRWFGKAPEQKDEGAAYRALVKQVVDACAAQGVLRRARPALVGRRRVGPADRPARDARPEQRGVLEGGRRGLQGPPGRHLRPVQRAARRQLGRLAERRQGHGEGRRTARSGSSRPSACRRCSTPCAAPGRRTS